MTSSTRATALYSTRVLRRRRGVPDAPETVLSRKATYHRTACSTRSTGAWCAKRTEEARG